jgi:hypothetical protein
MASALHHDRALPGHLEAVEPDFFLNDGIEVALISRHAAIVPKKKCACLEGKTHLVFLVEPDEPGTAPDPVAPGSVIGLPAKPPFRLGPRFQGKTFAWDGVKGRLRSTLSPASVPCTIRADFAPSPIAASRTEAAALRQGARRSLLVGLNDSRPIPQIKNSYA